MELENRIAMLERKVIELEKINEFQDRESMQFATKEEVEIKADLDIAYTDQSDKLYFRKIRRLLRRSR